MVNELDAVAVRVEHDGVPHSPERVPRLLVPLGAGLDQVGVHLVDLRRGVAPERERDPVAAGGRLPVGVEGVDRLDRIPGEHHVAGQRHLDVVGVVVGGYVHAEAAVEGERGLQIGDDETDHGELHSHAGDVTDATLALS